MSEKLVEPTTPDGYVQILLHDIDRGAHTILLDKDYFTFKFGTLTKALEYFHIVFVRLSKIKNARYIIQTSEYDSNRFEIRWEYR